MSTTSTPYEKLGFFSILEMPVRYIFFFVKRYSCLENVILRTMDKIILLFYFKKNIADVSEPEIKKRYNKAINECKI